MDEAKAIVSKIEKLKSKVRADLVEMSKHFERLSKLMREKQESSAALRCKGYMRIASAMIRGTSNLKTGLIIPESVEDLEEEESEEKVTEEISREE